MDDETGTRGLEERSGRDEEARCVRRMSTGLAGGGGREGLAGWGVRDEMRLETSLAVKALPSEEEADGDGPETVARRRPDARVRRPALAAQRAVSVHHWLPVGWVARTQDAQVGADLFPTVDLVLHALRKGALALGGVDLDGDLELALGQAVEVLVERGGVEAGEEVEREDEREGVLCVELCELVAVGLE